MTGIYIPKGQFDEQRPDILTFSKKTINELFTGRELDDVVNTLEQYDFEMVTSDRFSALWQNTSVESLLCFEFEDMKVKSYGSLLNLLNSSKEKDFLSKTPKNNERAVFVRFKNNVTQHSIR